MSVFSYRKPRPTKNLGYYSRLDHADIIDRIVPFLNRGIYYLSNTGVIKTAITDGVSWQTPWIHARHAPGLRCNLWHMLMFGAYPYFVPSKCQQCWKVTVAPRNLKELYALKNLQAELDYPSKCGIEVREYTSKLYGGYFYFRSLPEAKKEYEIIREAVSDKLSPETGVMVKRGCTEYEMVHNPSSSWVITGEQVEIENRLTEIVEYYPHVMEQPDLVKTHVERMWIHWAYAAGDKTYKDFVGDEPFYVNYTTYHDKSLEECELMIATEIAKKAGMDLEKEDKLAKGFAELAKQHGATREEAALAMGFLKEVQPIKIATGAEGEHDEMAS